MMLAVGFIAQAQQDIATNMVKPVAGSTITSGQAFDIDFYVKNVGPNAIAATDSIIWFPTVDGSLLSAGGQTLVLLVPPQAIPAGDSIFIQEQLTFGSGFNPTFEFCVTTLPLNFAETDTMNNTSCANVNFDAAISVGEFAMLPMKDNSFYSAGAYNVQIENISNVHANPTLNIYNIAGQLLKTASLEINNNRIDQSVELEGLPAGIYLMNTQSSQGTIHTQKVMIR